MDGLNIVNAPLRTRPMKAACVRGHAYTPDNTIWNPDGKYRCRTCKVQNAKVHARRRNRSRLFNRGVHPKAKASSLVVRQLFDLADEQGVSLKALAERSGYNHCNISTWRSGYARPYINAVVDLYNALGYDLVPVKRGE